MYKLIVLLIIPIVCFSQTSNQDKYQILDYEAFRKDVDLKNILLIDVRTPKEFNESHIEGAVNVDFYQEDVLNSFFKSLDNTKPVYIYCRSGNRSRKTSDKLIDKGFIEIYDLKGGYLNWVTNQKKEN